MREARLGPDHPDVAMTLDSLVALYYERGDYRRAERLSNRAIAIYEDTLGPDHPALATSVESRALVLRKLGRDDEAEEIEEWAAAIRRRHAQPNARR
jgi:tetratricopeptide (TPR) repeat protein